MERRISTLAVLCLMLSSAGALTVNIPQEQYEFARGDNITLPCSFQTKVSNPPLVVIFWSAEAPKANADQMAILTHYHPQGNTDIPKEYEGRVSLDLDIATGKANLKLSSITLAENKNFQCRLLIPGDDEGQPADDARLVVLVAPSTPICKIQGKQEYGQNINLTCKSEEGSPTPTYRWQSHDVRNIPRAPAARTTDKGGIMSLFNISRETSGYYICTATNKIRSASCNITVTVMPPSMNIGSTAGIIGGVVALLIALIVIIYCCCCRKKKKEEAGYDMGVREEYTDKEPDRNGESRPADRQDSTRSYDDSVAKSPGDQRDRYEERSERGYDRHSDYDDRRSDYNNRQSDYDDRRRDYEDRHDRYSDRHERYDDERHYNERRDRRYDDDRYDEPYDDRHSDRPPVPATKPPRMDYDD